MLSNGNMDEKTTSLQKDRPEGPTKEVTGTIMRERKGTGESPSVAFSKKMEERSTTVHKRYFPQTLEHRKPRMAQSNERMGKVSSHKMGNLRISQKEFEPNQTCGLYTQHKQTL